MIKLQFCFLQNKNEYEKVWNIRTQCWISKDKISHKISIKWYILIFHTYLNVNICMKFDIINDFYHMVYLILLDKVSGAHSILKIEWKKEIWSNGWKLGIHRVQFWSQRRWRLQWWAVPGLSSSTLQVRSI